MSLATDIINGQHDDDLTAIYDAFRERKRLLRATRGAASMAEIEVGDTVTMSNLRPKYINGVEVEVVGKRRTKIEVKFLSTVGKHSEGSVCVVPASCCTVVPKAA